MTIKTVGVVGAGQMGRGIAQVVAQAKLDVVLVDASNALAEQGRDGIAAQLKKQVEKGKLSAPLMQETVARIKAAGDLTALVGADLVIEAISENEVLKLDLFARLDQVCSPQAILASNTSSISITALAAATKRPEQVIGMHFMNPVPVMKLVEIIRGIATDEPTFLATQTLATRLDKTTSVAEDFPAFIVNRILVPMINEAIYALYEGVATVSGIDTALRLGANHKLGPLELADFIGLDTCLSIMQVLYEGLADSKYRPCPLLVKYVEAGWLGRKTSRGFYDYTQTPPRPTR